MGRCGPGEIKCMGGYDGLDEPMPCPYHLQEELIKTRTKIVTLCGSTKFKAEFEKAQLEETLAGNIVLTVGGYQHTDPETARVMDEQNKAFVDALHLRKISMSDEILVLNVGGYIGASTRREINFAIALAIPVRFLEEPA